MNEEWKFKLEMSELVNEEMVLKEEVKEGRKVEVEG